MCNVSIILIWKCNSDFLFDLNGSQNTVETNTFFLLITHVDYISMVSIRPLSDIEQNVKNWHFTIQKKF